MTTALRIIALIFTVDGCIAGLLMIGLMSATERHILAGGQRDSELTDAVGRLVAIVIACWGLAYFLGWLANEQ